MASVLSAEWDSEWRPMRNIVVTTVGVIGYSVPGVVVLQKAFDSAPEGKLFAVPILVLGLILVSISVAVFLPLLREDLDDL